MVTFSDTSNFNRITGEFDREGNVTGWFWGRNDSVFKVTGAWPFLDIESGTTHYIEIESRP